MTTYKVVWAGITFIDHYNIVKDNRFIKQTKDGGIKNCYIKGFENVYNSIGLGTANFCISKYGTDCAVDFYESEHRNYNSLNGIECDWLHLMYIDALPKLNLHSIDLSKVKNISCDFCNKYEKINIDEVKNNLSKMNVIFDNDKSGNVIKYRTKPVKAKWVWHDKTNATLTDYSLDTLDETCSYNAFVKDFIFTVGAGDKWASNFIKRKLLGDTDFQAMTIAHDLTSAWLEEVNEI